MKFTVTVASVSLPGGITFIVPSEEDIALVLHRSKQVETPGEANYFESQAAAMSESREKYLARAATQNYELTKPEHRAVKMAQVKHSTGDPITGRTTVNQIGVMLEVFPASVGAVPEDTTVAEYLEQKLYDALYPTQERIDFLLSR